MATRRCPGERRRSANLGAQRPTACLPRCAVTAAPFVKSGPEHSQRQARHRMRELTLVPLGGDQVGRRCPSRPWPSQQARQEGDPRPGVVPLSYRKLESQALSTARTAHRAGLSFYEDQGQPHQSLTTAADWRVSSPMYRCLANQVHVSVVLAMRPLCEGMQANEHGDPRVRRV